MAQRNQSKITKCEIILFLSDGKQKKSRDIKIYLEKVLRIKQRTGIDRHLRDLKRDLLIKAEPEEKYRNFAFAPGNGVPLFFSIDSDPSIIARIFSFMREVDGNRYVKKFMLSEVYMEFVHYSVKGIRRMISKFDEEYVDFPHLISFNDQVDSQELIDSIEMNILSVVNTLVKRNWWGLEWILLTSPDASELILEVLYWFEEFEKLWNKFGLGANNEMEKEKMKKEANDLYKNQKFKRAINYFERADNLRERYDKSGKIDTITFLIAILISDALKNVDYLNLVIPKSIYTELYNTFPIKRDTIN